ncbi:MAG: hypothetical protein ACRDT8_15195 [Micromonosporaceae bacterium]
MTHDDIETAKRLFLRYCGDELLDDTNQGSQGQGPGKVGFSWSAIV